MTRSHLSQFLRDHVVRLSASPIRAPREGVARASKARIGGFLILIVAEFSF